MSNINREMEKTYDAIVIGSGMSGGWAAKEFCEKGLKTLVLERGRMVKHIEDYPTMNKEPWESENHFAFTEEERKNQHKQINTGIDGFNKHFFVNDLENPYQEEKPFAWFRGYQVGGRSLTWGKHSYRLSDIDFSANANDGHGTDWPIRYKDIAPWYDYVEKFVGICGSNMGLKQLPDQQLQPAMKLNCAEKHLQESVAENFDGRVVTEGRVAHLTEPLNGRGTCQYRNRCSRGCPFGAYFSSNVATIPAAEKTGNLTIRPHSIVDTITYNNQSKRASGVVIYDEQSGEKMEFFSKIVFLNASTLNSTAILMKSTSDRFPNGMGNDSGELGHNLMDHHFMVGAKGTHDGFDDKYYKGRKPVGFYIPRFHNIDKKSKTDKFLRGYGYQGEAHRIKWDRGANNESYGEDFKDNLLKPGPWETFMVGFGEHLPKHENRMYLDYDKTDKFGQPQVVIDCEYGDNEIEMRKQMEADAVEMLEKAGIKNIEPFNNEPIPGFSIHEMGTARMGDDPKTSVLNKYNAIHAVPNVYVTDGSFMVSSACQNPSLTYMAFTARAVDHAVNELKKRNT